MNEEFNEPKIYEVDVRRNIVLAETGGELTMPLALLNKNCEFQKKWDKAQREWEKPKVKCRMCDNVFKKSQYNREFCSKDCAKKYFTEVYSHSQHFLEKARAFNKIYYSNPENRERIKERVKKHRSIPEVRERIKLKQKIRYSIPEVREARIEYAKKYYHRPYVIEKRKIYAKEYQSRPGVKERNREHQRKYYSKPGVKERVKIRNMLRKKVRMIIEV